MTTISTSEARKRFAELVNRVHATKRPIAIARRGKRLCFLVSAEALTKLEELEERADAREAARLVADPKLKRIPLEQVKRALRSRR